MTSCEGYFLISTFKFYNEQGIQKLDDTIIHALGIGIVENSILPYDCTF